LLLLTKSVKIIGIQETVPPLPDRMRGDDHVGRVAERQQIESMFSALACNRVEEFLAACSDQVLITVQGVSPMSSKISPGRFPLWWEGLQRLAEGTLVTRVVLTLTEDISHVVILRYNFTRAGEHHRFDTVNRCTFRDGALAAWFSRPLERREYLEAWGLPAGLEPDRPPVRLGSPGTLADQGIR
jgi:ketosteroid isomerase-like protein